MRAADYLRPQVSTTPFSGWEYLSRTDPAGFPSAPLDDLLRNRPIDRGRESPQAAGECEAEGNLFFSLRVLDIPQVDGRAVFLTQEWDKAEAEAMRLSETGADVEIHAVCRGYGYPGCELGLWSAGRLVRQQYFRPLRTEAPRAAE